MFEDAVEDFHSLDFIKARFEVWRRDYVQCYREAYIGLCLPKLFNPLVRLQLITWSPLQVSRSSNFKCTQYNTPIHGWPRWDSNPFPWGW